MERRTLEASGLSFEALVDGREDGRAVLLLHGFPQSSREWARLMPVLADAGYRPVAPDQRGYSPGARPPDVAAYRMEALVGDVLGLLDALGVERADLVGHDWGAAVAWQTAARFPSRVRSLTALSVPHPLALSRAMASDPDQQRRSAYIGVFRKEGGVAERTLSANGWEGLRRVFDGHVPERDVDHYVELLSAEGALTAALNWYRAASRADVEDLGAAAVPTLYIWSTEDVALGRGAAEATADLVTGPYRFVELAGVSHWIPDEAPDRLAGEILRHLEST
jgi:pimeloyl-ACP methyl ester carboxylesterase